MSDDSDSDFANNALFCNLKSVVVSTVVDHKNKKAEGATSVWNIDIDDLLDIIAGSAQVQKHYLSKSRIN